MPLAHLLGISSDGRHAVNSPYSCCFSSTLLVDGVPKHSSSAPVAAMLGTAAAGGAGKLQSADRRAIGSCVLSKFCNLSVTKGLRFVSAVPDAQEANVLR